MTKAMAGSIEVAKPSVFWEVRECCDDEEAAARSWRQGSAEQPLSTTRRQGDGRRLLFPRGLRVCYEPAQGGIG